MSAGTQKQIDALLCQNRFRLVRQTKHRVYRNPDGKVFVCPSTPSDWRAIKNRLTDLKRIIASDPVPEVAAISEFERQQALEKLAAQEKQVRGSAGPSKGRGTGFTYIDKKPQVISTRSPEEKQAEREQHAWDSLVRKTRQEFVASVTAKFKVMAPKLKEDLLRRFREYADTRLKQDLQSSLPNDKVSQKQTPMLFALTNVFKGCSSRVDKSIGADFAERVLKCAVCHVGEEQTEFCFEHTYDRCRFLALNIDKFMDWGTPETMAKATEKMFNEVMRGNRTVEGVGGILARYAVRKAHELAKQLLASRPMKNAA